LRAWRAVTAVAILAAVLALVVPNAESAIDNRFTVETVLSGLTQPTNVEFAPDGRIFVAEKSGIVKVFDALGDPTPSVFVDLRSRVHDFQDRGLLALELHPDWENTPYVYAGFTYDGPVGKTAPTYGTAAGVGEQCDLVGEECLASTQVLRFTASSNTASNEKLILWGYCEPNRTHGVGDLQFAPDGSLYLSHGESAWGTYVNYGQAAQGRPVNPCGDPNGSVGTAPTLPNAEGGMLVAQDLRTLGDPVGLHGALIRINPETGAGYASNPLGSSSDPNARRIVGFGLRNPFRFTFRPGTDDTYIGDVGWKSWEEIDRIPNPPSRIAAGDPNAAKADNFGWPCYEGRDPMPGMQSLGTTICNNLYGDTTNPASAPFLTYAHTSQPAPGVCQANASGAVSGLAFYQGSTYPAEYHGALFFTDYAKGDPSYPGCLYAIPAGPNGVPDVTKVREVLRVGVPVDLESGPGGDLYYVDIAAGTVNRIRSTSAAPPPVADLEVTPSSGPAPLEVTLDASGSFDPLKAGLTYLWDFDGDGTNDLSTGDPVTVTVYDTPGSFTARVTVRDADGRTSSATAMVLPGNSPPVPVIESPLPGARWSVSDRVEFTGAATDHEDGDLAGDDLTWNVILHHCPGGEACHTHFAGSGTGSSLPVTLPEHEMTSWIEATLTATDSHGEKASTVLELQPKTVKLTVKANVAALPFTFNSEAHTAPYSESVIANSTNTITFPSVVTVGGVTRRFSAWNTPGDRALTVARRSDTTLEARYVLNQPDGYWLLEQDGTVYPFGDATDHGDGSPRAGERAIELKSTPSGDGYWILMSNGRVMARGDAAHFGDLTDDPEAIALAPGEHPTTFAPTPTGRGYYVFTNLGQVLTFGDALLLGDLLHLRLNGPIIASTVTPSGRGYLMVGGDGGIFAFGDARYEGSVPAVVAGPLNQPVVGITVHDGGGYWLVAGDGGVFAFSAPYRGSVPAVLDGPLNQPVNGMVPYGDGYVLVASDGGAFVFSDRAFAGSLGDDPPDTPITSISTMG
jgi:glucose/arabinose dehydrogenase